MDQKIREQFEALEDRLQALEFAFFALVKELGQVNSLDPLHLKQGLQALSEQLLRESAEHPRGSVQDLTPVAEQVDELRVLLSELR